MPPVSKSLAASQGQNILLVHEEERGAARVALQEKWDWRAGVITRRSGMMSWCHPLGLEGTGKHRAVVSECAPWQKPQET